MKDKKTPMQLSVELAVTDGRGYSKVPYTKWFGQKRALKQWLRFSRVRAYRTHHNEKRGDKISLFPYLIFYAFNRIESFEREVKKFKKDLPIIIGVMAERGYFRGNSLESDLGFEK